jgi:quinol monooxygenase YgiN
MQFTNFDDFATAFNAGKDARAEAGINATPFRNIDDPNNACVIGTAPSKEAFQAFFSRPEMQKRMKNSGVLGPPEIKFLEET